MLTSEKKKPQANLERRRWEMFGVALVLIVSALYCALEWNVALCDDENPASIEDIMEDLDLDRLKRDYDMVAAIEEINLSEAVNNIVVAADIETSDELLASAEVPTEGQDEGEQQEIESLELPAQLFITPINDRESLVVMERMPEFPGGATAFMKWITANIKYPKTALDKKIEGRVVVSFIVDTEGNPTKLRLEESSNQLLGSLVIGALGKMPKWKPGIQNGQICSTMIRVPINFEL